MKNKVEFDDIEEVKTVEISKDGKIWGFTKYSNRPAIVIIPALIKPKNDCISLTDKQAAILKKLVKDLIIDYGYDDLSKAECKELMKELDQNYFHTCWDFEICDLIGTGSCNLTSEERGEIAKVMMTAKKLFDDRAQKCEETKSKMKTDKCPQQQKSTGSKKNSDK